MLAPGLSPALEASAALLLVAISVLLIALVVKLIVPLPAALAALIVWLLTKDKLLTAVVFLAAAAISLLKRL